MPIRPRPPRRSVAAGTLSTITAGLATLLAATLGLAPAVHAQRPDTARTARDSGVMLPPMEVRSSIAPSAGAVGSGIPARVTTVDRDAIGAWNPRLVSDVLGGEAGVSLQDDLGTPYKLNLSSRGFTAGPTVGLPSGLSVFLDGVRQNEPDAAEVNFDLLPLAHVERIELLSGAGSLLGPNSLGGAINLVTRRGSGPVGGELAVAAGSFDGYSADGSVGGSSGATDFHAAAGYDGERGWRDATRAERYDFFLNAGRSAGTRGVRVQALAARSRAETAGSLPESIFLVSPRTNFTAGDFEHLGAQQLSVSGFTRAGGGRLAMTTYARHSDAERYNVNQAPDDNVRALTRNFTLGGTLDWRTGWAAGGGVVALRLGADGSVRRTRVRLYEEAFEDPADQALTTEVESPGWDIAGYGLADYGIGPATISVGLRWDRVVVPFRDRLDPTADTTSTFARVSPRGGISVDVGGGSSVYASAGQAFRAPVVLELACADPDAACPLPFALGDDPPLDPVVATTLEAGALITTGRLFLAFSGYRTSVRDEILFVGSDVSRLAGYFANFNRTRREGIELSARLSPWSVLLTYASYAWTRATYRGTAELFSIRSEDEFDGHDLAGDNVVTPGDRIPLTPSHQVKLGGRLEIVRALAVGIEARYTGSQWLRGDEANETAPLDGWFAANARVEVSLGSWEVTGVVTNLFGAGTATFGTFNENRRTGALERFLTPMQPRSVSVTLTRRFGG